MRYEVLLTEGAERDLEAIYDYIAESDSPVSADYVLDQLLEVAESLATFPERGAYPRELLALGMPEISAGFFQALSRHLPYSRATGTHCPDDGWQAGYAVLACQTLARRVAGRWITPQCGSSVPHST